ncbi:MAG: hypothetical protein JOS17DRAFT_731271 [Linnemannia elongata]|nr:MAG: hypothetical protein JOS17DRAFT_731271 [Linnemannia elongata]
MAHPRPRLLLLSRLPLLLGLLPCKVRKKRRKESKERKKQEKKGNIAFARSFSFHCFCFCNTPTCHPFPVHPYFFILASAASLPFLRYILFSYFIPRANTKAQNEKKKERWMQSRTMGRIWFFLFFIFYF